MGGYGTSFELGEFRGNGVNSIGILIFRNRISTFVIGKYRYSGNRSYCMYIAIVCNFPSIDRFSLMYKLSISIFIDTFERCKFAMSLQ